MPAQIIPFPPSAPPAHILVQMPDALRVPTGPILRFYDVAAMARLVGLIGPKVTPRRRIETLRRLVADAGLPAPHNRRWRKGKLCKGALAVCAESLWDAAKVDAWFDAPQPGSPGIAIAPPVPTDWREEMRARATRLAAGGR